MAHTIYYTRGLVLSSIPIGEANSVFSFLTEEFGLIRGTAQSVRSEKSKLRFSLQSYTWSDLSLVRGRDMWRVTGAREYSNVYAQIKDNRAKRVFIERVASLIKRMILGEGKHSSLFQTVVEASAYVLLPLETAQIKALEALTVLRILYALGYVSKEESNGFIVPFVADSSITPEVLQSVERNRDTITKIINRALSASHL